MVASEFVVFRRLFFVSSRAESGGRKATNGPCLRSLTHLQVEQEEGLERHAATLGQALDFLYVLRERVVVQLEKLRVHGLSRSVRSKKVALHVP